MHAARAHNDREIVLRASESRENPTRGPGRSGCVAIVPTRVKGLFCVAWLWPGQAAGSVCFCVLVLVLAAFFLVCLAEFWACCLFTAVTVLAVRLWEEGAQFGLNGRLRFVLFWVGVGLVALLILRSLLGSRPFLLSLRTSVASLRCQLARIVRDCLRPIGPELA